jgi:hypothetical protein
VSYLSCPSCRFTVSSAAASSPFQNCPRCALREQKQILMVLERTPPRRFGNRGAEVDRIAEAKARLSGPIRGSTSSA